MITRTFNLFRKNPIGGNRQLQLTRQKWYYRDQKTDEPSFKYKLTGELLAGGMWFWVMWHMITDWEHFVGEHRPPNPNLWTDQELGIPPDTQ